MLKRVASTIAALAVLTSSAHAADAPPIKIGFSLAKTGIFATATPDQLNAYHFWRDQVNAAGGLNVAGVKRQIEFVEYDDQSNPANAVKIYEKLITDDHVDLVLSPWGTPTHLAVVPVMERFNFPMIGSTASSVLIRELKVKNVWFVAPSMHDRLSAELVKMAKEDKVETAAVIGNILPQAKEIRKFLMPQLASNGIKVVVDDEYPPDIKDLTSLLGRIQAAKPDGIFVLSYPADAVLYLRQAKEMGLQAKFQWMAIGPTMPFFRKMFGNAANGILTMGHWSPAQSRWSEAAPFFDAYKARFGNEPDYLDTILSYMSCQILEQAVAKAGTDKNKLRDAINTETFETVNGPVKFNGAENSKTPVGFLQIQDGSIQIVWPASIATAPFKPKTDW